MALPDDRRSDGTPAVLQGSTESSIVAEADRSRSIFGRALLALALLVGFYVLALAIAAALLGLLWVQVTMVNRTSVYLMLICIVVPIAIVVAIFPRSAKFHTPGIRLSPKAQPRLFKFLQEVAQSTGQAVPSEVYLEMTPTAWVSQRGGLLGIGARRVMGFGLPAIVGWSIPELRAVLAHEFGHYYSGDTALAPLVSETRRAIERACGSLENSFLDYPFTLYADVFMHLTQSVSRQQEYSADRLACRVAGAEAFVGGLRDLYAVDLAYGDFLKVHFQPILEAGFFPPISAGFGAFLARKRTEAAFLARLDLALAEPSGDPYDSHPTFSERASAANRYRGTTEISEDLPALSLFDDVPGCERRLIAFSTSKEFVDTLEAVEWQDLIARVYLPKWEETVQKHRRTLCRLTIGALSDAIVNIYSLADAFGISLTYKEPARRQTCEILGIAVVVCLVRNGWDAEVRPGEPIRCRIGGWNLEPVSALEGLMSGGVTAASWRTYCQDTGIAGLPLATAGA